jgi:hypothetical protein
MFNFVFIGACPRSGTTLLASMLGNSPNTVALPEGPFKFQMMSALEQLSAPSGDSIKEIIVRAQDHYSYKNWNIAISADTIAASLDVSKPLFPQVYRAMVEAYVQAHYSEKLSSLVLVIDNDPSNIKYGSSLSRNFPGAFFIHLIRDGRAVAASVISLDWGPNDIFSAVVFWLTNLAYGFTCEKVFEKSLSLRYENLLSSPEATLMKITSAIDIPFSGSMLVTTGIRLPEYTRGQHQLVGTALEKDRVHAWKRTLSGAEIAIFQEETYEMLTMLGYPPEPVAARLWRLKKLKLKFIGLIKNYVNRSVKRKREGKAG